MRSSPHQFVVSRKRALRVDHAVSGQFNFSGVRGWSRPLHPEIRNITSSQPTSQAPFALDMSGVYRQECHAARTVELRRAFRTPVLPLRKYPGEQPARRCKHASCLMHCARSPYRLGTGFHIQTGLVYVLEGGKKCPGGRVDTLVTANTPPFSGWILSNFPHPARHGSPANRVLLPG